MGNILCCQTNRNEEEEKELERNKKNNNEVPLNKIENRKEELIDINKKKQLKKTFYKGNDPMSIILESENENKNEERTINEAEDLITEDIKSKKIYIIVKMKKKII